MFPIALFCVIEKCFLSATKMLKNKINRSYHTRFVANPGAATNLYFPETFLCPYNLYELYLCTIKTMEKHVLIS